MLVDGWHVANSVGALDPDGLHQLATRPVTFAYHGDGASLRTTTPLI